MCFSRYRRMRAILLLALFALAAAHAELAPETVEYYTTADDNLDIATVVGEIARMKRFVDCFLDRAPCSVRTASYKGEYLRTAFFYGRQDTKMRTYGILLRTASYKSVYVRTAFCIYKRANVRHFAVIVPSNIC